MTASDPALAGDQVVFRRTRSVRKRWQRLGVRSAIAAVVLGAASAAAGAQLLIVAGLAGLLAASCAVAYLLEGGFRTVLATRGYVSRTIPWSEVAGFRLHGGGQLIRLAGPIGGPGTEPLGLMADAGLDQTPAWNTGLARRTYRRPKRMSIDVVRARGRAVRLPAPLVAGLGSDPGFNDALRQLEQWRLFYAGLTPPAVIL